eukprot:1140840-Pelagomonas_calceolata.AAC.2
MMQVLEGSQVYVDPALIAREPQRMADLLARTTRLLQVALDMQFQENEQHVSKLNVSLAWHGSPFKTYCAC